LVPFENFLLYFIDIQRYFMKEGLDSILKRIEEFADRAHGEQKRKYSNDRYIVHPIRVMRKCRQYTDDVCVLAAALLHDVLEDTPVTQQQLHEFLRSVLDNDSADTTLGLVVELTDVYVKETFPSLNRKQRKIKEAERLSRISGAAQTIKYADVIDNADVTFSDVDFAMVYLKEAQQFLKKMNKGNSVLYKEVMNTIARCINFLKVKE
jgi:(p)ppGpp synthase/HD superfamily hydrolase